MKISKKYYMVVFGTLMALSMSFTISLILTLINVGAVPNFLTIWLKGFAIGFIVALPTSLAVLPIMKRVAERLTSD